MDGLDQVNVRSVLQVRMYSVYIYCQSGFPINKIIFPYDIMVGIVIRGRKLIN